MVIVHAAAWPLLMRKSRTPGFFPLTHARIEGDLIGSERRFSLSLGRAKSERSMCAAVETFGHSSMIIIIRPSSAWADSTMQYG